MAVCSLNLKNDGCYVTTSGGQLPNGPGPT